MGNGVLASGLSREIFPIGETRATVLNQPSKEAREKFPFYWELPRDHIENIKWRVYVRERCLDDLEFREDIVAMCEQDVAFFAETLVSIFEPRPTPRELPPMLWLDQVDVLAWSEECYGRRDMGLEKSRGIGASWLYAIFLYHKWLFHSNTKIGMLSKDETSLDSPDSNSLMGKLVFIHKALPAWLRFGLNGKDIMRRVQSEHTLYNLVNGATVQGFVPTDEKVRSLRFTCMFYDEFAFLTRDVQKQMNSSVHTTPNRFFISTWNGPDNAFHYIMRKEKSTLLRCEMYWWNNPERWKGCYEWKKGKLEIYDKSYDFPKDYPFVTDGLIRSPWVDFELRRAGSDAQSALEELYGLQAESARKLLRAACIDIISTTVVAPYKTGDIVEGADGPIWVDDPNGPIHLYDEVGEGAKGPFSAGCDISFGRGASYSTLEVLELESGQQVLEFATNELNPVSFAQKVNLILRWLNGDRGDGHTYLTFENNGDQGNAFGQETVRLGYGNVMRRAYATVVPKGKEATYFGMRNRDGGLANLLEVERAVMAGECVVRSEYLRRELGAYDKDEKGKPLWPSSEDGHGDRAQGFGMAWIQARDRLVEPAETKVQDARAEIMGEVFNISTASWGESWSLNRNGFGV